MARLEHIGIAVQDAEPVARVYHDVLGVLPYKTETVASQSVRTHFISADTAKLELLEATETDSPITKFLARRGEGLHHLAFEVDDADTAFERMKDAGYRVLGEMPTPGADGKRIFFLHPKDTHGVLVELCETVSVRLEPEMVARGEGGVATYNRGSTSPPSVILLHGAAGCTSLETAPLLRLLEPSFRVIALDFRGHGASSPTSGEVSFDGFVQDVVDVLDHFEIETTHLFGFSMGGNVALDVARRHPERVRRVAVHGANIEWTSATVDQMQTRLDVDALEKHAGQIGDRLSGYHENWRYVFDAMHDWVATLPEQTAGMRRMAEAVEAPTLISCVDRDNLFPFSSTLTLHDAIPESRLAVFPGEHHALPLAPIDRLADTLAAWLADG